MKRSASPKTNDEQQPLFDFSNELFAKKQKTIDENIVKDVLSSLNELKSIHMFQTIFQMIHKDEDVIAEEFAYHSWESDLDRMFDYHLDNECDEDEELEDELTHVFKFVHVVTQKLKDYLLSQKKNVGANEPSTTNTLKYDSLFMERHEKEVNLAIRQYASQTVIPTVLKYVRSVKLSSSSSSSSDHHGSANTTNSSRMIIPKSVKALSHLDHSMTDRIRDMFLQCENSSSDDEQSLSLTVYASPHLNKDTIVPVFHTISDLLNDEQAKALVVSELKVDRAGSNENDHNDGVSDEEFHSMGDGSCVALVNDQELLIMHDQSLYKYTKQGKLTKLQFDTDKQAYPRFATSDIVARGDGENFVLLAASDESGTLCDLWNLHYPTLSWTLLNQNIEMPVPDALTTHDGNLYIIIPSSNEEKPSIFQKYHFASSEWSKVEVDGFFPLMERARIQPMSGHLLAFGDFESSTLLFAYNTQSHQWRYVDVDPVIRSEENLFDTLICKGMKDGHVVLYYEYSEGEQNRGYLQYVNLDGCL